MKQRMTASKLEPEAYRAVAYLDRRVAEAGIDGAEVEGEISEREVANLLMATVAINVWNSIAVRPTWCRGTLHSDGRTLRIWAQVDADPASVARPIRGRRPNIGIRGGSDVRRH